MVDWTFVFLLTPPPAPPSRIGSGHQDQELLVGADTGPARVVVIAPPPVREQVGHGGKASLAVQLVTPPPPPPPPPCQQSLGQHDQRQEAREAPGRRRESLEVRSSGGHDYVWCNCNLNWLAAFLGAELLRKKNPTKFFIECPLLFCLFLVRSV